MSDQSPSSENWESFLARGGKKGEEILGLPINALLYLRYHPDLRGMVRWNAFAKRIEVLPSPITNGTTLGEDADVDRVATLVQDWLQNEGLSVNYADLRRRVIMVAHENEYNPLAEYLDSLEWDGICRIDNFLIDYLGAKTKSADGNTDITEHVKRISRRFFIAAAARALDPGCQVDTVLILEGVSGLRKSSCFRVLGGPFACETELAIGGNKDAKQLAASAWIIELAEMDSLRGRDTSTINAFLTQPYDFYRAPYDAGHKRSKRLCIFVGTTNKEEYIVDSTGDRRFWPAYVTKIDIKKIEADRDQLWAEAVYYFKNGGRVRCPMCASSYDSGGEARCLRHRWWLDPEEQRVADLRTAERREPHAWQELILNWWLALPGTAAPGSRIKAVDPMSFSYSDVAECAIKLPEERWEHHRTQVGNVLRQRLGFETFMPRGDDGKQVRRYRPSEALVKMREMQVKPPKKPGTVTFFPGKKEDAPPADAAAASSEPPKKPA